MTITFPVSVPDATEIRHVRFRMVDVVGIGESPYTLEQEVFEHDGKRWEIDVQLPPLKRANAEEWAAFLASLRGRRGTFLLGDPLGTTARGALGGTPLVKGGSQTGLTLAIDGCTADITNWMRKGDWFQLGTDSTARIYKLTANASTNGSGETTLDFWPSLRVSPTDNDALTVASTKGLWRLASNVREYDEDLAQMFGFSFSAVEAL